MKKYNTLNELNLAVAEALIISEEPTTIHHSKELLRAALACAYSMGIEYAEERQREVNAYVSEHATLEGNFTEFSDEQLLKSNGRLSEEVN